MVLVLGCSNAYSATSVFYREYSVLTFVVGENIDDVKREAHSICKQGEVTSDLTPDFICREVLTTNKLGWGVAGFCNRTPVVVSSFDNPKLALTEFYSKTEQMKNCYLVALFNDDGTVATENKLFQTSEKIKEVLYFFNNTK